MLVLWSWCDHFHARSALAHYLLLFPTCKKKVFSSQSGFCTQENTVGVIFKQQKQPEHKQGQGSIGQPRGCITLSLGEA